MNPDALQRLWYRPGHPLSTLLAPLGWVRGVLMRVRSAAYGRGWLPSHGCGVPLLVVGNVVVGGTGKTPLVAELARRLLALGRRPGIVARGYRGASRHWPRDVDATSDPFEVGDEPVMLAILAGVPVVVAPDRVAAARRAVEQHGCDVVLADDGLQHLRLQRNAELAVVDARRGLGNGRCLPAGPLREPAARLAGVDLVLHAGADDARPGFSLVPVGLVPLGADGPVLAADALAGQAVDAIAGIGDPQRFFDTLRALGYEVHGRAFADHHRFVAGDLPPARGRPLVMTDKDAVKCRRLVLPPASYALRVGARLNEPAEQAVSALLQRLLPGA